MSEPEPLLTLITTQHPLIGTAINGSVYAYESSKAFSPRFRTSAEFVERNIGNPMVSTVEVMGRRTGVENGMRRWLESRPRSAGSMSAIRDVELGDAFEGRHTKKRKISAEQCVEERLLPSIDDLLLPRPNAHRRAPSQASLSSLPPYDDQTSPSYELVDPSSKEERIPSSESRALQNAGWQQRLVMTTSGLGVAMRTESLERLKYCLGCLRWANHHLDSIIHGLRSALDEWDRRGNRDGEVDTLPTTSANATSPSEQTDAPAAGVGSRIQALSSEVTNTLAKITSIISSYAGAALPDNARQLVTQHLITLPQRYSLASRLNPLAVSAKEGDSEGISIARKMLVLAVEGVDMMAQVSAVMSGTIDRAEEWCQKLGRGGVIRGRRLEDVKEQMEAGEERNGGGEKGKEQELPSKGELH